MATVWCVHGYSFMCKVPGVVNCLLMFDSWHRSRAGIVVKHWTIHSMIVVLM